MAKKSNKNIQPVKGVFSNRPRIPKKVEEPQVGETQVESTVEEPVEPDPVAPEPELEVVDKPSTDSSGLQVVYEECKEPKGSKKENGVILAVVLSSALILTLLGFLFYYEHSWRLQEQQETTIVDSKYDDLRTVVKGYVGVIHESNKAKYCKQISEVYRKAAKSTDSIEKIEDTILKENRKILGFEEDDPVVEREYEWQALLSASGIIHTWLTERGITVTKANQRDIFTAIAEGFE